MAKARIEASSILHDFRDNSISEDEALNRMHLLPGSIGREFSREHVKEFVIQMMNKMMPKYKELQDFKGKDIYEAIEFGENKTEQLERLVYLRAISEMDERIDEFVNTRMK